MTESDIKSLIAGGESLTVEFKGEERELFNEQSPVRRVFAHATMARQEFSCDNPTYSPSFPGNII